jgi:hypothetical protein
MKTGQGLFLLAVFLIQIGATTSDSLKPGLPEKSKRNHSALGPQGVVSDSVVNFFSSWKTGKDLMAEKNKKGKGSAGKTSSASGKTGEGQSLEGSEGAGPVALPVKISKAVTFPHAMNTSAVTNTYRIPKLYRSEKIVVPSPPVPRVSVPQVRQEIQKILELNKQIQAVQGGRAGQLRRVQEQARIHQKVLDKIEAASGGGTEPAASKTPGKETLLNQEKLRIIHEETQRNTALLEAVGTENATTTPEPVSESKPRSKNP